MYTATVHLQRVVVVIIIIITAAAATVGHLFPFRPSSLIATTVDGTSLPQSSPAQPSLRLLAPFFIIDRFLSFLSFPPHFSVVAAIALLCSQRRKGQEARRDAMGIYEVLYSTLLYCTAAFE